MCARRDRIHIVKFPENPIRQKSLRLAISVPVEAAMGDATWQDYDLKQVEENLIYFKDLKR